MKSDNGLVRQAYELVRQRIFDFDLYPGQIVSDHLLSKELNMSRTPLRQALIRLEREGLLEENDTKKNYRVTTINVEDIQDLFDFRIGIETTAFSLAWKKGISPERIDFLQQLTDTMLKTHESNSFKEHFFADQQFHNELVSLSGNKRLMKANDEMLLQLTRMRFLSFLENSLQDKACKKHQVIVNAIRNNDYDRGLKAVINHLESSRNDYINLFGSAKFVVMRPGQVPTLLPGEHPNSAAAKVSKF